MAVSKRKRFEVFKRDGFACQYCGGKPPKVVLECDHMEPVSKGGSDDIDNLITSCFDCNRGKSNHDLEVAPASVQAKAEILIEQREQMKAYRALREEKESRLQTDIDDVSWHITLETPYVVSESFERRSIRAILEHGLTPSEMKAYFDIAYSTIGLIKEEFSACNGILTGDASLARYFCGICWKRIRENK